MPASNREENAVIVKWLDDLAKQIRELIEDLKELSAKVTTNSTDVSSSLNELVNIKEDLKEIDELKNWYIQYKEELQEVPKVHRQLTTLINLLDIIIDIILWILAFYGATQAYLNIVVNYISN